MKRKTWTVTEPWRQTLAGEAFSSFDMVFAMTGTPVSQDKVSLVFCVCIDGQRYYVKQYHNCKGIRSWFGLSRIRQEARNQLWFSRIGLSAAQVVAYGEEHILSRTFRGGLITASIEDTRDLAWIADNRPELLTLKEVLGHFIQHRKTVVIRRTRFDLQKAGKDSVYKIIFVKRAV